MEQIQNAFTAQIADKQEDVDNLKSQYRARKAELSWILDEELRFRRLVAAPVLGACAFRLGRTTYDKYMHSTVFSREQSYICTEIEASLIDSLTSLAIILGTQFEGEIDTVAVAGLQIARKSDLAFTSQLPPQFVFEWVKIARSNIEIKDRSPIGFLEVGDTRPDHGTRASYFKTKGQNS